MRGMVAYVLATAVAGGSAAALVAPAHAEQLFSKREAKAIAIDFGHQEYGLARWRLSADCTTVGDHWEPGRQFHDWRCVWGTNRRCYGVLRIRGNARGPGWYDYREDRGYRCRG